MSHTPMKRVTSLIAITLLSGCTLSPVKDSSSAAPEMQTSTHESETNTTLKMFVFQGSDREGQQERAGYLVEFEPKFDQNDTKNRSTLIYKD